MTIDNAYFEVSMGGEVLITIMQTVYLRWSKKTVTGICQLCKLFVLRPRRNQTGVHHLTYISLVTLPAVRSLEYTVFR